MKTITDIGKEVNNLLIKNTEWGKRYKDYGKLINSNKGVKYKNRKKFHITKPLTAYSSISDAKNESSNNFDIRYKGQSVGKITINNNRKTITLLPKTNSNKDWFDIDYKGSCEWISEEAKSFRKEFIDLDKKTKSPEHEYENKLLNAFSRTNKDKIIKNIRPVTISDGCFFQMPTPLGASSHSSGTIKYSGPRGGGIDILARAKIKGQANHNSRLVVFELKDENKTSESPEQVILQATAYGVFIARLLQEDRTWWEIFGFDCKDAKNDNLHEIFICTLMPKGEQCNYQFENESLKVGDIRLTFHTLFFEVDKDQNITGFNGSLCDVLQK